MKKLFLISLILVILLISFVFVYSASDPIVEPYLEKCDGSIDFRFDEKAEGVVMEQVGKVPGYATYTQFQAIAAIAGSPNTFLIGKLKDETLSNAMSMVPSQISKMFTQAQTILQQIKSKAIDLPEGSKLSIDCNGKITYDNVKINEGKTVNLNSECNEADKSKCQKLTASGANVNTICDKKDEECSLEVETTSVKGQINYGASDSSTWTYSNLEGSSKMSFRTINGKQVIDSATLKLNENANQMHLGTAENNRLLDVPKGSGLNIDYSMVYDKNGKAMGDNINIEKVAKTDSPIVIKDSQTQVETKLNLETCKSTNPPCVKITQDVADSRDKGYWIESIEQAKVNVGSGDITLTPIKNPVNKEVLSSIHTKADGNVDIFNADVNYNGLEFKQEGSKELLRTTISPKPLTAEMYNNNLKLRGNLLYEDKKDKKFYLATEQGTEIEAKLRGTQLELNNGYQGSIKLKDPTTVMATLDSRPLWAKEQESLPKEKVVLTKEEGNIKTKAGDETATIVPSPPAPSSEPKKEDKKPAKAKTDKTATPKAKKPEVTAIQSNDVCTFNSGGMTWMINEPCENILAQKSETEEPKEPEDVLNEEDFKKIPDEIDDEMFEQAQKFMTDSYVNKRFVAAGEDCNKIEENDIKIQCNYYNGLIEKYVDIQTGQSIPPPEPVDLEKELQEATAQSIPPAEEDTSDTSIPPCDSETPFCQDNQEQTTEKPKFEQPVQSPNDIITQRNCVAMESLIESQRLAGISKEGLQVLNNKLSECKAELLPKAAKPSPPQPPKVQVESVERPTSPERKNGPRYYDTATWDIYWATNNNPNRKQEHEEARCLLFDVKCPAPTLIALK